MAEKIDSNIREMESLLNKVVFLSGLTGKTPSVDLVRDALKDYRNVTEEKISPDAIIECVCKYFGLTSAALLGKKKNKEIVEPRQICMYLMADMTNMPLETVGNVCGGSDHTTVMHARDKIERLMPTASRIRTGLWRTSAVWCSKNKKSASKRLTRARRAYIIIKLHQTGVSRLL